MPVTCYLDESATDGSTPFAVVGGLILNDGGHREFTSDWRMFLDRFSLWPALHMKEFGLHGKLGKRRANETRDICRWAVDIIDGYKIYSLSCRLSNQAYATAFSEATRKNHSQYKLCFLAAALVNRKMAEQNDYEGLISFVMDDGNPRSGDLRRGYEDMEAIKGPEFPLNHGGLSFADDHEEFALQAADVICWGERRKASGLRFRPEHRQLELMLSDETTHSPVLVQDNALYQLERYFRRAE